MFLKTPHLKFIDGILHQLHEPHPNVTDKEPKWVAVESETTKPADETEGASSETKPPDSGTDTGQAAA
jgi:hypothetical protein